MRSLLLFRGAPGCGKSTFIEKNGLKQYALSADDIRLLCQNPALDVNGNTIIAANSERTVWDTLFKILEIRMKNGDFTVIDATNSKTVEMNRYKDLAAKYRYRMYIIDMTDLPIEECKRRNASRPMLKRVPEEAIDKMYSRFKNDKIPSGIKVLKPDELNQIWYRKEDFSEYESVHVIGDIHGCYTVLKRYIENNGNLSPDNMYVFVGDYVDRGIENAETMKYLYEISKLPNVYLLEGNHERWLYDYGNDVVAKSKEFEFNTKPQLISGGFTKQMAREFYRKLCQCCCFKYGAFEFLVTHGGLSTMPYNLTLVATKQMIHGVGKYEDADLVDSNFTLNSNPSQIQIHGHRNVMETPISSNGGRTFNLEGRVEFGGSLRCVEIKKSREVKLTYSKNEVFKNPEEKNNASENIDMSVYELVQKMRSDSYIRENKFGRISSFNFTKQAFRDWKWNEQINKARGLYIDNQEYKVVARAYEKFFAIGEVEETSMQNLQANLRFPIVAYKKENGFLGIVSWNTEMDDLLITTKSRIDGDYAVYLKDMLYQKYNTETINKLKEYIKKNDVSFVFECCDMEHDPHVIEYDESELFLLDVVKNQLKFEKFPYDKLVELANDIGVNVKEKVYTLNTWQEFRTWLDEVSATGWKYNDRYIEGFVIEDSKGFMLKVKLQYYKYWKRLRRVAQDTIRSGSINYTGSLLTPMENDFYGWCKMKFGLTREEKEQLPKDICTLRKMFYEDMGIKEE